MSGDTLSTVLRDVRLRGAVFFCMSGSGDWVAETPPASVLAPLLMRGVDHLMEFHVLTHGSCWAGLPDGPAVQLKAGDVVMFPQGDAHVVSSAPGMRAAPDLSWLGGAQAAQFPVRLALRGRELLAAPAADGAPDATVVCGFLGCDLHPFNPLVAALPRLLHLGATDNDGWLAGFAAQAVAESSGDRPGGEAMLARMSEMLFVHAVRRYAEHLAAPGGWLAGLADRFVGRALALLHEQPAHDWTLDELGRSVGLSRSALHERFVQLVGIAPMQYLAQWRMQAAARLLLDTRESVAAIALEVGYESEAAFARAFKRQAGSPPATWRRARAAS